MPQVCCGVPELPDLVYYRERLEPALKDRAIRSVQVRDPVVLRNATGMSTDEFLIGGCFRSVQIRGPFLIFELDRGLMVVNCMLAGHFSLDAKFRKSRLLEFELDDGWLAYHDSKKMGKIYLALREQTQLIPRFEDQGVDIIGPGFSKEVFLELIAKSRRQVRAFLMDQTLLSSIGNAYADEILFEARLHPKTFCHKLNAHEQERLFRAIQTTMQNAIESVRAADPGLEHKYRQHVRVRNRLKASCPRCATLIRRVAVLGHDAFFCPTCQPADRKLFIDWSQT